MGNNSKDDEPTNIIVFVEREVGARKLNILHQVYRKPDGKEYLREVGKLSTEQAEERYGLRRNDYRQYYSGELKA